MIRITTKVDLIKNINSNLGNKKVMMENVKFFYNDEEYRMKTIFVMKGLYAIYGRQKRTSLKALNKQTLLEVNRRTNNGDFHLVQSFKISIKE